MWADLSTSLIQKCNMNMVIDDRIEMLITRSFLGELNNSEKAELQSWLDASNENRSFYLEQKKVWEAVESLEKMKLIDEKGAFKKVSNSLFTNKRGSVFVTLQRIAAILFIPLFIASIWMYVSNFKEHKMLSSIYQTFETPLGMRSNLTLPDGSKVWLNAGSRISYPLYSKEHVRKVKIDGEVYFEVAKMKDIPFIVDAGNVEIEVLGTKFNCCAYANSELIQTALLEGSVKIRETSHGKQTTMIPGELVEFSKSTNTLAKSTTNLDKYVAWKSGKLMFREDPMDVVIEKLGRWYNIDIQVVDKEIRNYVYTATFENEKLEQVLDFLELSAPISYYLPKREIDDDGTYKKQVVKLYNSN